jgi:hypothetical protein
MCCSFCGQVGVHVALVEAGALYRCHVLFGAELASTALTLMWRWAAPPPPGSARQVAPEDPTNPDHFATGATE